MLVHLGSFILNNNKRKMNNLIREIIGLKKGLSIVLIRIVYTFQENIGMFWIELK